MAMASPGQGAGGLVQFLPFAIILGIFYFMILMPMKRRQKKVQEFQQALKVGDKIVTTSGIYGQITEPEREVGPGPDRRQGAHRGRAGRGRRLSGAGAGRHGERERLSMYKNLRWKIVTILVVFVVFFGVGVYPLLAQRYRSCRLPGVLKAKQLKLGLDLKGGVQLVMRVNTDDALKLTTIVDERAAARLARAPSSITRDDHRRVADEVPRRGRAAGSRLAVPQRRPTRSPAPTTTAIRSPAAPTSSR